MRFNGDLAKTVTPTLEHLETQLSWQPQSHLSLVERIGKIGGAFLSLKEIEFLGATQQGNPYERAEKLMTTVLARLESDWQIKDTTGGVIARVKRIRTAILPELMNKPA